MFSCSKGNGIINLKISWISEFLFWFFVVIFTLVIILIYFLLDYFWNDLSKHTDLHSNLEKSDKNKKKLNLFSTGRNKLCKSYGHEVLIHNLNGEYYD